MTSTIQTYIDNIEAKGKAKYVKQRKDGVYVFNTVILKSGRLCLHYYNIYKCAICEKDHFRRVANGERSHQDCHNMGYRKMLL